MFVIFIQSLTKCLEFCTVDSWIKVATLNEEYWSEIPDLKCDDRQKKHTPL